MIDIYQKLNGSKDIEELEDRSIDQITIEEGDFLIINKEGEVINLSPLLYFYISYEAEDEIDIIIRVLSFGPNLKVVGPESFIKQIKSRLEMQRSCGQ